MRTTIVLLLLMAFCEKALAEGVTVGTGCSVTWSNPPGPVDGFRVYVGTTADAKTLRATVTTTAAACSALSLAAGQNYAHIVAFNVAGNSVPSVTLPFVLVTSPPPSPAGLFIR